MKNPLSLLPEFLRKRLAEIAVAAVMSALAISGYHLAFVEENAVQAAYEPQATTQVVYGEQLPRAISFDKYLPPKPLPPGDTPQECYEVWRVIKGAYAASENDVAVEIEGPHPHTAYGKTVADFWKLVDQTVYYDSSTTFDTPEARLAHILQLAWDKEAAMLAKDGYVLGAWASDGLKPLFLRHDCDADND